MDAFLQPLLQLQNSLGKAVHPGLHIRKLLVGSRLLFRLAVLIFRQLRPDCGNHIFHAFQIFCQFFVVSVPYLRQADKLLFIAGHRSVQLRQVFRNVFQIRPHLFQISLRNPRLRLFDPGRFSIDGLVILQIEIHKPFRKFGRLFLRQPPSKLRQVALKAVHHLLASRSHADQLVQKFCGRLRRLLQLAPFRRKPGKS